MIKQVVFKNKTLDKQKDIQKGGEMTDQTRWGIPEVHTKNKIKKYQDDNFNAAVKAAEALTRVNLVHLMQKLEKVLQDKEEKYEREAKERADQKIYSRD